MQFGHRESGARLIDKPRFERANQMATITASLVNELRAKTGQGMMECKKMLTETAGDLDAAVKKFREKGVKESISGRATTEGRVEVLTQGNVATAVEVVCNTDFTAKSD